MILRSMKNNTGRFWDMVTMPDTVIDRANILGKYQQEILVFTDRKFCLVGDGGIELTGVYGNGYEIRPH